MQSRFPSTVGWAKLEPIYNCPDKGRSCVAELEDPNSGFAFPVKFFVKIDKNNFFFHLYFAVHI